MRHLLSLLLFGVTMIPVACSSVVNTSDGGGGGSRDSGTDMDMMDDAESEMDSGGGGGACSPANCTGCCQSGVCYSGVTSATCGKGGAACTSCSSPRSCLADRTCGIDPNSMWKIQPVSATISTTNNGQDWDFGGGAPDPYALLWCPPTAGLATSRTATVMDTFFPTWATGGCTIDAGSLMLSGYAIAFFDEDISVDDVIAPKTTITVTENDLVKGFQTLSNGTTLITAKITFTKQ
jgi:hypothetical protein